MVRTWIAVLAIVMTGAWDAVALTGSATSGTNPLETVSPTLDSITAVTEGSLTATFSEPLLPLGAAAPENYAVSGSGAGTLNLNPSTVTGTGPYALTWSTGEMQNAQSVVLTATGIQDLAGNPINPLQNSASCAGMGTAPTFSNLQVVPAEGSVDQDVTLTFTASEPLNAPPTVTVNGHPANYVSGSPSGDYVYTYTVQASDPIGAASVAISGTDAAGNPATFDDASTLSIAPVITKLPLNSRPLALVLLVVGLLTLALRSRRAIAPLFLLALLLACTQAFAAGPTVSNVTFAQSPDGSTGTKVDIYYDLLAPTGSCAIELSLSKDGGADGFSHPMDHYTGDIAGVTTGTSKHIVWDIRADYPEENIPLARIRILADDGVVQHTVTYAAGSNGSILGTSTQTVIHGASGTAVSAVPDTNYHFVQWSDGITDNPRTDTNVTTDKLVTALFAINTHSLTYSAETYGTITGTSPQTVDHGSDGTQVTAVPNTGYHFTQWSDGNLSATRTDTNITADLSVTASFAIDTHTLTYAANTNGSITGISPQTVNYGASGTAVSAVPDTGYHFVQWSDSSTQNPRTDTNVTNDLSVTASFAINTYTITYTAGTNGTLSGISPQTINHGADATQVTAVPDTGYHFLQWSDNSTQNPRTDTNITTDLSLTAGFAINTYSLTYAAGSNGSISGISPQTVSYGSSGTQVTAVPSIGYHFVQWSDGVLTAARTDATVVADLSVSATFAINTYTLTYTPGTNGTITGTSPQSVNYGASGSQVTAVPNTGYHFVQWSDGVLTAARTDATVVADLSVAATFAINTYTLTYTAGANGTITGTSPQTVNYGASGTAVTAVPNTGYGFSQWSDGVLTAARTETNVTADTNVSAIFGPLPVVSSFALDSGAPTTISELAVTLDNSATNTPTLYMASESALFTDATWQTYATSPEFSLSTGVGTRTVYFKVKNGFGESDMVSDTIIVTPKTVPVASGTFTMGRTSSGDDATNGFTNEDAQHSVLLGAYQIAKYDVTNKEFCDVLNWAKAQGYLCTGTAGMPWTGTGNIYAGASPTTRYLIVSFTSADCNIQYSGGLFTSKTRTSTPSGTTYSMDTHPMVRVSWYGSVAFCNWMSLMQGLTPCYDMTTANWPLTIAPPTAGGYRLPTEAEWECAAAWDGSKHWTYGFMSDTNSGAGSNNRCNDYWFDGSVSTYLNPFSLSANPFTSPVGWFNGVNVSPSGNVTTVNSPSPVGAYDMSGQVWQWCQDSWDKTSGYGAAAAVNPIGVSGTNKVYRGGSWFNAYYNCRTARRDGNLPTYTNNNLGFRISMSN